jgi:uncharacterized protein YegL
MPDKNLTEIVCVIDRSGSMSEIREDAEGGFNEFVKEHTKGKYRVNITLVQFDTQYDVVWESMPAKKAPKYKLHPRGATALLDAIGKTIRDTEKRFSKLPAKKKPARVIFVIVTDGMENSSREFTRSQVFEMINHRRSGHDWNFMFLAANQDAIEEAGGICIPRHYAMNYANTGKGMRAAFRSVSCASSSFGCRGESDVLPGIDDYAPDEDSQSLNTTADSE